MDLLQLISDALSIITISMCLFLKVPQIKSLYKLKNARGINLYSIVMEIASYTTTMLYNYVNGYALLTYMEYPIIIIQQYVLIYLVLIYQDQLGTKAIISIIIYFGFTILFLLGILPGSVITYLVPFCTPVSLSSKGIQLWEILRTKNADSVSVTTWIISVLTNLSRTYTIVMDSADLILLSNFSLSTFMSGSIALAAHYYQTTKSKIQ